jgi:hypothetical protein
MHRILVTILSIWAAAALALAIEQPARTTNSGDFVFKIDSREEQQCDLKRWPQPANQLNFNELIGYGCEEI